ncbi:MAG: uridylate kinase [Methylophilales bacterium]|nr:uridylate kinase [Methylophilales bacterium]
MIVVKLGGSLLGSTELPLWLSTIASNSDGHVVIVPGGGAYADVVRKVQKVAKFDDAIAHQLAVLAMDQFGLTLAALEPRLVTARHELEIAERSWQHRGIIWLPSIMVLADENIPQNWDVTSDSLAAWLATQLNAKHLVIVKSISHATNLSPQQLAEKGWVDPTFPYFSASMPCPLSCLGLGEIAKFSAILRGDVDLMT